MKKKYILNILLILIILTLVAGYYAYNEFNRKNENLSKVEAAFSSSPDALINEFSKDAKSASQKYFDKVIQVEGPVKKIETSDQEGATIVLGDENSMTSLRFSIDSTNIDKAKKIQPHSIVLIKGMCNGYNADDMGLGSDILFNRAVIIETKK
jgi:tRNA_anti-like